MPAAEQLASPAPGADAAAQVPPLRVLPAAAPEARRARRAANAPRASDAWTPLATASVLVIAFVLACALVPDWIAPFGPTDMDSAAILQAPGAGHWLGTDQYGRDVFSLLVWGARQSVVLAVCTVLVSGTVGVSIGLLAGYAGGWTDKIVMRVLDVLMAIPDVLLAIAIATALGPSLRNTILAISLAALPRYARVLRGQALSLRSRPFVEAARTAGASHLAILRGHVLPHCVAPILVLGTLGIGTAILMGSSLSFLGLGVNDDRPDWGFLLSQGRSYLTIAWWSVMFPGLAITALVISANVLGDTLRRRLDPRGKTRR